MKELLRNKNVIKTGIDVFKDSRYLLADYGICVMGTFDVRFLVEDCGHKPESLKNLSKKILDADLDREEELIASDWDKNQLADDQMYYAESSVKASIDIFKTLIAFAVSNPNRQNILNYCQEKLDRAFIWYSNSNK